MWLNNILDTIGNTPLIKLNKITKNLPCTVLAKVEYFNPGNSIKDRMALHWWGIQLLRHLQPLKYQLFP